MSVKISIGGVVTPKEKPVYPRVMRYWSPGHSWDGHIVLALGQNLRGCRDGSDIVGVMILDNSASTIMEKLRVGSVHSLFCSPSSLVDYNQEVTLKND